MKKLLFSFIFIFAASLLSGCNADRTRTVIFTENPPPLTTMTMTTTSFADTFSEYMATYSESETASESSRGNPNTVSRPPRAVPDTGIGRDQIEQVSRDTAAVFTFVVTDVVTSYTENSETTAVTEVPELETESTTTSVVETTAETESSTVSMVSTVGAVKIPLDTALKDRPQRDTAFLPEISKDTAYSSLSITENGGTTNADQYTE
ncbi:MAG: hypothetical protein K2H90_00785 [Oscillospiraceae bacterium]|nr:hypothetical protein [Oscillospiraceae bacterium]